MIRKFSRCRHLVWVMTLVSTVLISTPALSAQCATDATTLYAAFKNYRERINTASKLEELTPYFSNGFKKYYLNKLTNPEIASNKPRFLTQYWDNLNTAKDIVIVYHYALRCNNSSATLILLTILNRQPDAGTSTMDLWEVKIHYVKEHQRWRIDGFEYDKSKSDERYAESQIIDNFVLVH